VKVLGTATAVMALLATAYGPFSPWMMVHSVVPGAGALRIFHRATMILIPLTVMGFAIACHQAAGRHRWWLLAILVAFSLGEQPRPVGYIDKDVVRRHVATVARQVDPGYQAFFLVGTNPEGKWLAEDAAWAGLSSGVPTINGRYGNFPKRYEFNRRKTPPLLENPQDQPGRDRIESALNSWLQANGIERPRVQWIEYEPLTEIGWNNYKFD